MNDSSAEPPRTSEPAQSTAVANDWTSKVDPCDRPWRIVDLPAADHFRQAATHIRLMSDAENMLCHRIRQPHDRCTQHQGNADDLERAIARTIPARRASEWHSATLAAKKITKYHSLARRASNSFTRLGSLAGANIQFCLLRFDALHSVSGFLGRNHSTIVKIESSIG